MRDDRLQNASQEQFSLSGLFANLFDDMVLIARQEIQLARVELTKRVAASANVLSEITTGGLLAYVGLLALLIGVMLLLAKLLPLWGAGLVVGLLVVVAGVVVVQMGRRALGQLSILPEKTIASIQRDVAMMSGKSPATKETNVADTQSIVNDSATKNRQSKSATTPDATPANASLFQVLKTTVQEWIADEASLLAAALSYYTAISLAPLLVLIVVIVGLFLSQDTARDQVLEQMRGAIGTQGGQFLEIILENADQPGLASVAGILSFLTLLWGSTNLFGQLQNSLNKIWDVEPKPGRGIWATVKARLLSFSMVLGVAFLLLVSFVISAVLSALSGIGQGWLPGVDWLWQIVNFVVSLGVITLLFAAIYKVLPDANVAWRDVWIGAGVTALLFTIGKTVLGLYLANAGSAYGVAGSLVVFLLWVYYSTQILFFGAEFTQVYSRYYGKGIEPAKGAQRIGESN